MLLNEKKIKNPHCWYIKRAHSTISIEVNKWVQNEEDIYDGNLAYSCATEDYLNKRNLDKISTYSMSKIFVYKGLLAN
jgi:hypothetical protein